MGNARLAFGESPWKVWIQAVPAAVVGNLLLRAGARALFDVPTEFAPLATPGPTVFFTVLGTIAGLGVAHMVGWFAAQPVRRFRQIAVTALVVSFGPDLWMFTAAGSQAFPGATVSAVLTLMLQHGLAAFVILWLLTMRAPSR